MASRGDPFGVSGEQRCVSNVLECAVQHDYSFQTDASAAVGVGAVAEALNIVVDGGWVDALRDGSLPQHFGVVDTLGA
jgi:hypothetical protein